MQASPTLLFIPDISGFTKFVSNTEITHSQHIIGELLETIIDSNELGLEVSEIEGDAVLFFRRGKAPTATELLKQVQQMYTNFHSHLNRYDTQRICQCGACCSASGLSIKIIVHYGEIAQRKVSNFHKLFGKDLIVAHRLMKNEIPSDEYVLFTHELLNAASSWDEMKEASWKDPIEGSASYDFGTINYCYLELEELKKHIPTPKIENYLPKNTKQKYETFERIINAPLEMVFSILTDLSFRKEWIPYLKDTDKLNTKITQSGSTHRCVVAGEGANLFFINHSFDISKDRITFYETEPNVKLNIIYTLERIDNGETKLRRVHHSKNGLINRILYFFKGKKALVGWVNAALDNFKAYCDALASSGRSHPNSIILPKTQNPKPNN